MRTDSVVYLIRGERVARRRLTGVGASATAHVLSIAIIAGLTAHVVTPAHAGPAPRRAVDVFSTPALPFSGSKASDRPAAPAGVPDDLGLHIDAAHENVDLPGFAFNFGKVIGRAASLFPFLTGSTLLDELVAAAREPEHGVANPLTGARGHGPKPPLVISAGELHRTVDAAWARRDRWSVFGPIHALLEQYDPNRGQLPVLLRTYTEENGLQPYVDMSTRDPRLWVQLGLVADHADFLRVISSFTREHASTKAATELLFLLDKIVQGSYDALITLLDVDPPRDLVWTRRANPAAYQALVAIRTYYQRQLSVRHLTMPSALRRYFDGVRLAIMMRIIETTPDGYRKSDALFLSGEIGWREGRQAEAVRIWQRMRPDPGDVYARPASAILEAIRGWPARPSRPGTTRIPLEIDRILDSERGRWLMFSMDRLRQFGYRLNEF